MAQLKGWRYVAFIGTIVGGIAATIYPIIIAPMIDPTYYQNIQKQTRAGIKQELIQPGNMKVWTDPFDRKKE
ncbi:Small integral membrane protein 20 [Pseudolycoriella hygida]|uniref:Small integral membrane protein 20 n=1 Tax=Pseudolycoriella hygida TaxID=35572 RepID=A0A9Q0NB82_9DIPT|nr:Small integral membrane protein 20 [Pseudolycoriella hygida]